MLVSPVGGDADLAHLVHRVRPDLDLERLAVKSDHGGVEALVEVGFGDGNVVVELAGNRMPHRVDDAESCVTVLDLVYEYPDRIHVVDLADLGVLALHLSPDAVQMLGPARPHLAKAADRKSTRLNS